MLTFAQIKRQVKLITVQRIRYAISLLPTSPTWLHFARRLPHHFGCLTEDVFIREAQLLTQRQRRALPGRRLPHASMEHRDLPPGREWTGGHGQLLREGDVQSASEFR